MFTGLVESIGVVKSVRPRGAGRELSIRASSKLLKGISVGDSMAVDGCCQTIVRCDKKSFSVVAVSETLSKTTLGNFAAGTRVNLERPMQADSRLGGHFVLGHVDGVTKVTRISGDDTTKMFWFALPKKNSSLVIPVGSIAVNGVSLTVARLTGNAFAVAIIPHTFEQTTFSDLRVESTVNIEYDMLGKYVERILSVRRPRRK
jgi:riboflavin synthase